MANQQAIAGSWDEVRGKIREKWGQISNQELQQVQGNMEQLLGLIQRRTGEARERIEAFLDDVVNDGPAAVRTAMDSARQYVDRASDAAHESYDKTAEAVRRGYSQAEAIVQRRPAESVAVAFGAGLITGLVASLLLRGR